MENHRDIQTLGVDGVCKSELRPPRTQVAEVKLNMVTAQANPPR